MAISHRQFERIEKLLGEGISRRKAAKMAGVSRGVVTKIGRGEWQEKRQQKQAYRERQRRQNLSLYAADAKVNVQRIFDLAVTGLSGEAIGEKVGLSAAVVHAILTGAYKSHRKNESGFCPGCGVNVKLPCLACQVRRLLAAGSLRPRYAAVDDDAGDNLKIEIRDPETRRRYEKLCERKRLESEAARGWNDLEPATTAAEGATPIGIGPIESALAAAAAALFGLDQDLADPDDIELADLEQNLGNPPSIDEGKTSS